MIKTLRQAPFLRLSLFYIAGIIFGTLGKLPASLWAYVAFLSFLLIVLASFFYSYKLRWMFGFTLSLFLFSLGVLFLEKEERKTNWSNEGWKEYTVEIIDEPVRKPKTWMCLSRIEEKKVILYISADSLSDSLCPGDLLLVRSDLQPVDVDYLRKKGIAARGFVSQNQWEKTGRTHSFNLRYKSLAVRNKMLEILKQIIPEEESYSIASALLTGYKDDLTPELRKTFAVTGTSHILAVSGFHFSAIYGMIYFCLAFLGRSRKSRILTQAIILPVIWFYAFLTGLEPSVIRAVFMLSLWGIGDALFLRTFTINTLCVAAFFMLVYNPLYLFDVGFQLSFSAVLSIVVINPHLVCLYQSRNPILKYGWELCSVSLSAQVGTLPFCLFYFHQFPLTFLISNLFAVPLSGILLFLLPFSLFVYQVFPGITLVGIILNKSMRVFISGLKDIEAIPNSLIEYLNFSLWDSVLMTAYLVSFVFFLIRKRVFYFCLGFLFVIVQVFHYFCR